MEVRTWQVSCRHLVKVVSLSLFKQGRVCWLLHPESYLKCPVLHQPHGRQWGKAFRLYQQLREQQLSPNLFFINTLFTICKTDQEVCGVFLLHDLPIPNCALEMLVFLQLPLPARVLLRCPGHHVCLFHTLKAFHFQCYSAVHCHRCV